MIWSLLLRIAAASATTPDEPVTKGRPPQTAGAATSAIPQIRARLASTPKSTPDIGRPQKLNRHRIGLRSTQGRDLAPGRERRHALLAPPSPPAG